MVLRDLTKIPGEVGGLWNSYIYEPMFPTFYIKLYQMFFFPLSYWYKKLDPDHSNCSFSIRDGRMAQRMKKAEIHSHLLVVDHCSVVVSYSLLLWGRNWHPLWCFWWACWTIYITSIHFVHLIGSLVTNVYVFCSWVCCLSCIAKTKTFTSIYHAPNTKAFLSTTSSINSARSIPCSSIDRHLFIQLHRGLSSRISKFKFII